MADKTQNKNKHLFVKEENAIILDYLSLGYTNKDQTRYKRKPIAQAIGTEKFTLLELIPKENVDIEIHEKVYIGSGKRDKIKTVKQLKYENLTPTSRIELEYVVKEIVEENEEKYIEFFNTTGSLSTRLHKLELIPGIGKKMMWSILDARKEKPFESYEDLKNRVPSLPDPVTMISNRILQELDNTTVKKGKKKYYLFTQIPNERMKEYYREQKRKNRRYHRRR
ncbi:DUF655 domain-containing protein [Methanobrevibacter boviskoreani]|jgi:putative nucleotide binding protein|uniref:DUF655 domain-containing protein n=1 Tax=Methanobrevibacter boviskoreani TaxID=1348249 RepID=UPI0023A8EE46|nr:DUF655 domain-containing protein [Methanobrevibacter boviskoreani]MCI6930295.1 DUF655 domain-containing protein [Methanobrevibacter boviskoreani]MDD6256989.1 DUF655 domain-containing protein [Methanobrevibacter boviskoreani]MDY5614938.1 DUF655 domain-containing protein [Methanobrevibacter boviskoreani]